MFCKSYVFSSLVGVLVIRRANRTGEQAKLRLFTL